MSIHVVDAEVPVCSRYVKSNGEGVYAWLAGWQFVEVSPVFSFLVLVVLSIHKWRG